MMAFNPCLLLFGTVSWRRSDARGLGTGVSKAAASQPQAGLPNGSASQPPSLPAQCGLSVFCWPRPGSPLLQKVPVHQRLRRKAGSFFAKSQMPHSVPYTIEFKPLNPSFKALHQLVIPAQLESPTLQLCPGPLGCPGPLAIPQINYF